VTAVDARAALRLGWLLWGLSAVFYAYGFFQRVAPSVMVDELMRDFAVSGALLGNLSAFYFYAYAGLQIPVGVALDRYGPRRVVTLAALLCGAGSLLFAVAGSLAEAYLGRLLIGAGAGVTWVAALSIAMRRLPPRRFALVTGLTLAAGMAGAVGGQAPLAALVQAVGWRATMLWGGVFAAALAAAFWWLGGFAGNGGDRHSDSRLLDGLRNVARQPQSWLIAAATGTLTGPMLAFGGLWGVPYLMQAHGLGRPAAAALTSVTLVGWGIGGPLAGWASDRLGRRKPIFLAAAALMLGAWLALLLWPALPRSGIGAVLFAAGIGGGGMIVAFAIMRDRSTAEDGGAGSGFLNTVCMGAGAVMQPWIGLLLDWQWQGTMAEGARLYDALAFERAFWSFPAVIIAGMVLTLFVRETYCRAP
jgi:MFS family permease